MITDETCGMVYHVSAIRESLPLQRSPSYAALIHPCSTATLGCHPSTFRWCPSIAWMKGLQSVVSRLLSEPVAKVRGHTIAQQFLHGPHMVRQTCSHSRCD